MRIRCYIAIATACAVSLLPASTYAGVVDHPQSRVTLAVQSSLSGDSLTIERDPASNIITGRVSTSSSAATFKFDGRTLRFGDGYGVRSEVLVNDQNQYVVKLVGFAPDNETAAAEAVIQYDKQSGAHRFRPHTRRENGTSAEAGDETGLDPVTRAALDQLRLLMAGSRDFAVVSSALPSLTAKMTRPGNGRVAPNGVLGCIGAGLLYIAATLDLIAACGVPEPLEPLACAGAYFAFVGAGLLLADACEAF